MHIYCEGIALKLTRRLAPFLVVAVLALVLTSNTSGVAADERNFTLINASGITITDVYVSAADVADWGDDILGREVLFPGEEADILFSRYDGENGQCLYDIRVIGQNGEEGILYGVNLCETTSVTFS